MSVRHLSCVSILVRDYDEAIAFYTEKLGFCLVEDTDLSGGKRWVRVAAAAGAQMHLLLAKADGNAQTERVGDQTGGRVFLILQTDDFARDYAAMRASGVVFCEEPREETYGKVAVFEDLSGNKWDLLEPRVASGE